MNNELVLQGNNPIANIKVSTDVAGACKEIVTRSAVKIQNKKYVPVEGWMAIATAHGCNLSATDVKQINGGISARGIVRRITDGLILGEAEGFVGEDEKIWQARPLYARRAMAQTRAMSRAARSVFAHVVVLMDAGLSTTPAEEMGHNGKDEEESKPEIQVAQPQPQQTQPKYLSQKETTVIRFNQSFTDAILSMNGQRLVDMTGKILDLSKSLSAQQWGTVLHHTRDELEKLIGRIDNSLVIIDDEFRKHLNQVCGLLKYNDLSGKFETKSFISKLRDLINNGLDPYAIEDLKKEIPADKESIKPEVVSILEEYKDVKLPEQKLSNFQSFANWFDLSEYSEYYRKKRMLIVMNGYSD